MDCTDRPSSRYLLSDVAVCLGVPLVSGAAIATSGQWAVYCGHRSDRRFPCYRCVWPSIPPNGGGSSRCEDIGVLNVATGMVGIGMAREILRLILDSQGRRLESLLSHMLVTRRSRTSSSHGANPLEDSISNRADAKRCQRLSIMWTQHGPQCVSCVIRLCRALWSVTCCH